MVTLVLAWPCNTEAESGPREYAPPGVARHHLAAGSAQVIVTDARPPHPPGEDDEHVVAEDELSSALLERLTPALGSGQGKLEFHFILVEAREISQSPPVVRAILDITVKASGRALVSTRGTSTLHGAMGGMSPRTDERIRGAVTDAFERTSSQPAFVDAVNAALADPGPARLRRRL